jgi:hypothetical protein
MPVTKKPQQTLSIELFKKPAHLRSYYYHFKPSASLKTARKAVLQNKGQPVTELHV